MIGYLMVAVAVAGTGYAAYLDLRTTEVPDLVSYATAMGGIALHGVFSYMQGDWSYLLVAVTTGTLFFLFGVGFYLLGVWGGADAFVLGAMGYALPYMPPGFAPLSQAPWPFQATLVLNLFLVGTIYVLGFALYRGLRSHEVMEVFWEDMKDYWRRVAAIAGVYIVGMVFIMAWIAGDIRTALRASLVWYLLLLVGLLFLYRYLKIVEEYAMTEEMSTDELEEGDVIRESVEVEGEVMRHQSLLGKVLEWLRSVNPISLFDGPLGRLEQSIGYPEIVGLTEKEVEKIQETRETVTRRSGVRFVPSFPVAILVSVLVGDVVYMVLTVVVA